MKPKIFLATLVGLASLLGTAAPGLTESTHNFPVIVKHGNCPKNVKLYTRSRYYEGGGEWTVTTDTLAIARRARLVSRSKKEAVFRASLKPGFKSCRGVAKSKDSDLKPYAFNFHHGQVTFRVILPKNTPSNPSEITQARIYRGRPFMKWAIAD